MLMINNFTITSNWYLFFIHPLQWRVSLDFNNFRIYYGKVHWFIKIKSHSMYGRLHLRYAFELYLCKKKYFRKSSKELFSMQIYFIQIYIRKVDAMILYLKERNEIFMKIYLDERDLSHIFMLLSKSYHFI
jgi:hypothetical protein